MPLFPFSPWTDMYKMKLDFILSEAKKLKEYVAASSASATAAAASADDAEASADDAALSATQATGSAQDAAESATQAAGSADDAADSADSAASAAADAVAPISSLVNTLDNAVTVMQSQMAAFINSHSGTRDETLLWSAPTLADGLHYIGQTCVLSESPDSFDYIIVNYENSGSAEVHPAKTADLIDPYKGVTIYSPALDTSGAHMILKGITIACNDNTDHTNYIVSSAKQIYWDGIAANAAIEYVSSTSSHYYAGTITSIIGVKYLADAEVADIRVGADGTIYPTAGDAVRGQVSDLKSAFSSFDNRMAVININGNLIPYGVNNVIEGNFYYESSGNLVHSASAGYDTYIIPITEPEKTIYFKKTPYSFVTDSSGNILAGVNNTVVGHYDLSTLTDAALLYYCHQKERTGTNYVSYFENFTIQVNTFKSFEGVKYRKTIKNITPSNVTITSDSADSNAIRQGVVLTGSADLTGAFSYAELGFMKKGTTQRVAYILLNNTSLGWHLPSGGQVSAAHGLTIANNVQIVMKTSSDNKITAEVISNGHKFKYTWVYENLYDCYPYFEVDGMTTTGTITWECTDLDKKVWLFGDSYMTYDPTRWVYHLATDGYADNCMIDQFGGRTSASALQSLISDLKLNKPEYAVWGLGMNDGSDSADTPVSAWFTNITAFIELCNAYEIKPILCTIPSVPTINNEQKNAWIRSSGYQFIDFAKAVNAQADGTWYADMLSSDGVHPSATGGMALYGRVLQDFPQITIK